MLVRDNAFKVLQYQTKRNSNKYKEELKANKLHLNGKNNVITKFPSDNIILEYQGYEYQDLRDPTITKIRPMMSYKDKKSLTPKFVKAQKEKVIDISGTMVMTTNIQNGRHILR